MATTSAPCCQYLTVVCLIYDDYEKNIPHISPLLAILGAGCTHNDGDIGPWFGTWQLEETLPTAQ